MPRPTIPRDLRIAFGIAAALALVCALAVSQCGDGTPPPVAVVADRELRAIEDTARADRHTEITAADADGAEADRLSDAARAQAEINAEILARLDDLPTLRSALAEPLRTPSAGGTLPPDALADSVSVTCRRRGACS